MVTRFSTRAGTARSSLWRSASITRSAASIRDGVVSSSLQSASVIRSNAAPAVLAEQERLGLLRPLRAGLVPRDVAVERPPLQDGIDDPRSEERRVGTGGRRG